MKSWKGLSHQLSKRASLFLLHPLLLDQASKGGDMATFLPTDPRQSERTLHIFSSPAAWWEPSSHQGEWRRKVRWEPCFPGAQFGRSLPKIYCAKTQGIKGVTSPCLLGLWGVHFVKNYRSHLSSTIHSQGTWVLYLTTSQTLGKNCACARMQSQ